MAGFPQITPTEVALIKSGIDLIKSGLATLRKKGRKHKYSQCVSTVITEVLKENPDFTLAEAQLAAARATGIDPDMDLLRAQSMLRMARNYKPARKKTAMKAKWAGSKVTKKITRRVRRSRIRYKRKR